MAEDPFEIELELRQESRGGLATVASALIGRW
jgi:hypothetical protein